MGSSGNKGEMMKTKNTYNKILTSIIALMLLAIPMASYAEVKKAYYESGALKAEFNYENGKKHGLTKVYYESGALEAEANFENGKRHGLSKYYSEDEKLIMRKNYIDGKVVGSWEAK